MSSVRSEEHTSELQSHGLISYAVFCLKKKNISTWSYLLFSGFASYAVGTIFFTLALIHGNPTVVIVILNIQPVFLTVGATLLIYTSPYTLSLHDALPI